MNSNTIKHSLIILFSAINIVAYSQGCVAIRNFGSSSETIAGQNRSKGTIELGLNYRYFKSFRHFRGSEENSDRVANETEVINHSNNWEYTMTYWLNHSSSFVVGIPTQINTRSSLYEHGRNERNLTSSRGMGDMRVGLQHWIKANEDRKWNQLLGVYIKLPTGNFKATDIFYNIGENGAPEVRPVDQSIQLGDGGFGFILNSQFVYSLSENLFLTGGGSYLFNPREVNGTRTFRETLSSILNNERIMSVPDQFSVNLSTNYLLNEHNSMYMGMRFEGVTVRDVLGGSSGFRRPGNVLSIEPGYSYMIDQIGFNLSVPIAVKRVRPQSVTDLETQKLTGNFRNGDAAFADYLINFTVRYTFKDKSKSSDLFKPSEFLQ